LHKLPLRIRRVGCRRQLCGYMALLYDTGNSPSPCPQVEFQPVSRRDLLAPLIPPGFGIWYMGHGIFPTAQHSTPFFYCTSCSIEGYITPYCLVCVCVLIRKAGIPFRSLPALRRRIGDRKPLTGDRYQNRFICRPFRSVPIRSNAIRRAAPNCNLLQLTRLISCISCLAPRLPGSLYYIASHTIMFPSCRFFLFILSWSAAVVAFSIKNRLRLRCSDFETFLGLHTKCSSMVMMINRFC